MDCCGHCCYEWMMIWKCEVGEAVKVYKRLEDELWSRNAGTTRELELILVSYSNSSCWQLIKRTCNYDAAEGGEVD